MKVDVQFHWFFIGQSGSLDMRRCASASGLVDFDDTFKTAGFHQVNVTKSYQFANLTHVVKENEGQGEFERIPRFSLMKVDVQFHSYLSIKLTLWTRDRAEVKRARQFR